MEQMNILIICRTDWGGVSFELFKAINKNTNHNAIQIVSTPHPYGYDFDSLLSEYTKEEFKSVLELSDFVLVSASDYDFKPYGLEIPNPKGIYHVGTAYRTKPDFFKKHVHPDFDIVFAGKDTILEDKIKSLNATIDTNKYKFKGKNLIEPIKIGHSPSNRNTKNTNIFIKGVELLKQKYEIDFDLIENVNITESIKRKEDLHFLFDQIANYNIPNKGYYGYGIVSIEAACFGDVILGRCNIPDVPILNVQNEKDIFCVIDDIINNDNFDLNSNQTRAWVEREHSYEAVSKKFINDIKEVIK